MEPQRQEMLSPVRASELNDRESEYENHKTIESNHSRKKATGSSFYDKTLQAQKQQVIVQQNEWNQQMLRIFSNTNNISKVQVKDEEVIPELKEESEINIANTQKSSVLTPALQASLVQHRARQKWD